MLRRIRESNIEAIKLLLEDGADINAKYKNGRTALMCAAWTGHPDIVKLLIVKGADINAKDKNGQTALMYAAYGGHTEVVRLLINPKI